MIVYLIYSKGINFGDLLLPIDGNCISENLNFATFHFKSYLQDMCGEAAQGHTVPDTLRFAYVCTKKQIIQQLLLQPHDCYYTRL